MCSASNLYAVPAGPVIGSVSVLFGDVSAVDQDGDVFELTGGGNVYAGITFTTVGRSLVRLIMNDGTVFSLGSDGTATVDAFSYDPDAQTGEFLATIEQGTSFYESGAIGSFSATRQHTTISTPDAVIGVRGSEIAIVVRSGFTVVRNRAGNITLTSTRTGNVIVLDVGQTAEFSRDSEGTVTIDGLSPGVRTELNNALDSEGAKPTTDPSTRTSQDVTTIRDASSDSGGGASSDTVSSPIVP